MTLYVIDGPRNWLFQTFGSVGLVVNDVSVTDVSSPSMWSGRMGGQPLPSTGQVPHQSVTREASEHGSAMELESACPD